MDRKRKSSSYLILIVLLFFSTTVKAQIDTAKIHQHGMISLTGSYININATQQLLFISTADHQIKYKNFEFETLANWSKLSKNDVQISDDWTLKLQPRIIHENWSIFNYEQFSSVYSRKINFRSEFAAGGGLYWLKTRYLNGTIAYAIIYVDTKYADNSRVFGFRQSPRLQLLGKYRSIKYSVEGLYQPMIEDLKNVNYNYAFKLGNSITPKLDFSLVIAKSFESYAFQGTQNLNSNWSIGFTYSY